MIDLASIATRIATKSIVFVDWEDYSEIWSVLRDLDILNNLFGDSKSYYLEDHSFFCFILSKNPITYQDLIDSGFYLDNGHFKKFDAFTYNEEYFDKHMFEREFPDFDSFADYVLDFISRSNWEDSIKDELINFWKLNKRNMSLEEYNSLSNVKEMMES